MITLSRVVITMKASLCVLGIRYIQRRRHNQGLSVHAPLTFKHCLHHQNILAVGCNLNQSSLTLLGSRKLRFCITTVAAGESTLRKTKHVSASVKEPCARPRPHFRVEAEPGLWLALV